MPPDVMAIANLVKDGSSLILNEAICIGKKDTGAIVLDKLVCYGHEIGQVFDNAAYAVLFMDKTGRADMRLLLNMTGQQAIKVISQAINKGQIVDLPSALEFWGKSPYAVY